MPMTKIDSEFHDVRVRVSGRGLFEPDHEFDAVMFAGRVFSGSTDITHRVTVIANYGPLAPALPDPNDEPAAAYFQLPPADQMWEGR